MSDKRPSKEEVRSLVRGVASDQYTRNHRVTDTSAELDRLHDLLVAAAQAYEAGPSEQRQSVCNAVMATADYLMRQGFSSATLVPLSRVVWGIVDLCEQNRSDPLFCEKTRKTKARRGMKDAVRQGQLAALTDVYIKCHKSDEGDEATRLERAARRISGAYFGKLTGNQLRNARSYQRQTGHHELLYDSYEQMRVALTNEASSAGGGADSSRVALEVQIDALNAKAELRGP